MSAPFPRSARPASPGDEGWVADRHSLVFPRSSYQPFAALASTNDAFIGPASRRDATRKASTSGPCYPVQGIPAGRWRDPAPRLGRNGANGPVKQNGKKNHTAKETSKSSCEEKE